MTSVEQLKGLLYSPKVACHFNSKKDKETHVILILRRPPINLNDLQCSLFLRRPINLNDLQCSLFLRRPINLNDLQCSLFLRRLINLNDFALQPFSKKAN